MMLNQQRSSTIFLSLTIYSYVIAEAGNCNTIAIYTKNYTETNLNLLIASFVTLVKHATTFLKSLTYDPDNLEILLSIISSIFTHMAVVT